jgi:hypothetical protein
MRRLRCNIMMAWAGFFGEWLYMIAGTICVLLIVTDGKAKYGFVLAAVFATLLFAGPLLNRIYGPAQKRLATLDSSEYKKEGT